MISAVKKHDRVQTVGGVIGAKLLEVLSGARELGPLQKVPPLSPKPGTVRLEDAEVELFERLKAWRQVRNARRKTD